MQKLEQREEMGSYIAFQVLLPNLTCHSFSLGEKYDTITPKYDLLRETSSHVLFQIRYFEDIEIYVGSER